MRWTRLLLLIAGVLLTLAVITAATVVANPDLLREPAARLAGRLLQREVRIDGELQLDLGRRLTLAVAGLRIANPDWRPEGPLLQLAHGEITLDTASLFGDGPVIVERLVLQELALDLARDATGNSNWQLGTPGGEVPETTGPGLLVREVAVSDSRITYTGPGLAAPVQAVVVSLRQQQQPDGLLKTDLAGTLNQRQVQVHGELGPFASLVTGRDLRFDLAGRFDTLQLEAHGRVDDLAAPQRPEFDFRLAGPDVRDLGMMLGLGRAGVGDVDLSGRLGAGPQGLSLDVQGNIGAASVRATGHASELTTLAAAGLDAEVKAPNLGRILAIFGIRHVPEEPFVLSARLQRDGDRLRIDQASLDFADARFDASGEIRHWPRLADTRLQLEINGSDIARFRQLLGVPGIARGPFKLSLALAPGDSGPDRLDARLTTELATVTLTGPVGNPPSFTGTRLRVDVQGDDVSRVAAALNLGDLPGVPFAVNADLELLSDAVLAHSGSTARIGEQQLSLTGRIGLAPLAEGTDLELQLSGPDAARLAGLAGVQQGVAATPYSVRGRLRVQPDGYRFDGMRGRMGRASFELDGLLSRQPSRAGSRLKLSASGPDLEEVLADTPQFDVPAGAFEVSGQLARRADAVQFSDLALRAGGATLSGSGDLGWPLTADSQGRFDVAASGPALAAVLPASAAWEPPPAPFGLQARGNWRRGRWQFDKLDLKLGAASAEVSGLLAPPPGAADSQLRVTADIPDLAALGKVAGNSLPQLPLRLSGLVAGTGDELRVQDATVLAGDSDFTGSFRLNLAGETPRIEADVRSQSLDLRPWLAPDDGQAAAPKRPRGERLIPDTPLRLDALKRIDARLEFAASAVQFRRATGRNLTISGELQSGALDLRRLQIGGEDGRLEGALRVTPAAAGALVSLQLQGDGIAFNLFGEEAANLDKVPVIGVDLDLQATGNSLHALAASLNGPVRITSRGGRVPRGGLALFTGDFLTQLVETINPFSRQDPYTEIACTAVVLQARNGQLTTAPVAVAQTDKLNILTRGSLNLGTEAIDFSFRTAARKGLGISAAEFINPYFKVAGTLGDPQLTIDVKSAAVTGGAAVLTAGLSLLAKAAWDRVFRAEDPCAKAIQDADKLKLE